MEELGTEQRHFPLSKKPGLSVDLEDHNNLFSERFHFLIKLLYSVHKKSYDGATYSSKRSLDLLNAGDVFAIQLTHPAWEIHRKMHSHVPNIV
jgi:hypothetical protein